MADPRLTRQYQVYVIELDPAAWQDKDLRKRNPDRRLDKPCVYVGYSVKTPEERWRQHHAGENDAPLVRRYGLGLKPRLYRNVPVATTRGEAEKNEATLASRLRRRGYGVWEGKLGALDLRPNRDHSSTRDREDDPHRRSE